MVDLLQNPLSHYTILYCYCHSNYVYSNILGTKHTRKFFPTNWNIYFFLATGGSWWFKSQSCMTLAILLPKTAINLHQLHTFPVGEWSFFPSWLMVTKWLRTGLSTCVNKVTYVCKISLKMPNKWTESSAVTIRRGIEFLSLSLAIVPLISLFTIIMICSANINGNRKWTCSNITQDTWADRLEQPQGYSYPTWLRSL